MEKKVYYKYMFIIAAIYPFINTLVLFVTSIFMTNIIWLHNYLFIIFIFGIGYIFVSMDISKNHGIIKIAIIVKIGFFIVSLLYLILGDSNFLVVILGGLDILFVCLFIEFLLNYKKLQN